MRRSRLLVLAFVSLPVLACERTLTPVQPPVAAPNAALFQNDWFPIQSDYIACNGDVLNLVGQMHIMSVERYNEAGHYQSRVRLNMQGTGTGPDGSVYRFSTISTHLINDPATGAQEVSWLDKVRLIGKGPAANESFRYIIGGTMNASGEITSLRWNCSLSCISLGAEDVSPAAVACE